MSKGAKKVRNFQKPEMPKKTQEQIEWERRESIRNGELNIRMLERELKFKTEQMANGITETRNIHTIPDGTAVTVDGYKDNMKPEFLIKNEIDLINSKIEGSKDQIKTIKEMENARKAAESGNKG